MPSIIKLLKNPAKFIFIINRLGLSRFISDQRYLKIKFKASMGKPLNLADPKTYNEKLQWLKLNDRNPLYINMVDKFEVKQYVLQKIGEEYIIPTLGVWETVDDIDFKELPGQFVLKCTHDSGGVVICKDKLQLSVGDVKKRLRKALKKNFFYVGREWPYLGIQPRILAEPYLEDHQTGELRDYKFFCFDGEPKALFVATERQVPGEEVKFDFFDMNYHHIEVRNGHDNAKVLPQKPQQFELMKELAKKLSKDIPHVRVDFYEVNGKVYFGEMTFFHFSGMMPFEPEEWDYLLGSWISLPAKQEE